MKMVALLRPLSAAAFLRAPAAPLTGSAVAAGAVGGRRWRSVRANAGGGWLSGLLGGKQGRSQEIIKGGLKVVFYLKQPLLHLHPCLTNQGGAEAGLHLFGGCRQGSSPVCPAASYVPGGKGGGASTAMAVTPGTVKAGDPVLHEPAQEVAPGDVRSEKVQGVIDRMVDVMRKAPGVGLAAPQIGVPLRIIVLEDTQEYISYAPKKDIEAQDRRPFDLLVIINPKLKNRSKRTALFFEGCLSVDGYRAVVERHLDVEVSGLDRNGSPIKVQASGWQARILQHECDHLEGTLYVDKMVPRTFRIVDNLDLPLPSGCPQLGAR